MKAKQLLSGVLIGALSTTVWAQSPKKMTMTTEVPEGIATPDKLETSIGTLTSVDGVPDAATTQKVYDQLDLNRATEAFLNGLPIASMYAMEHGILKHGPANTTAVLFEDLMDSKALWLTPNTTSVYMASWLELSDEPMVIETPPNVLGFINDAWFQYVTDFGNAGPDKGKGASFSFCLRATKGTFPRATTSLKRRPLATGSSGVASRSMARRSRRSMRPRSCSRCILSPRRTIPQR